MYIKMLRVQNTVRKLSATMTFSVGGDYTLASFNDNQSANNWVNTGYNQHGSTYIKSTMNERHMTLNFYLNYKSVRQQAGIDVYAEMLQCFNPLDGLLTLQVITLPPYRSENDGYVGRQIDAYVAEPPALVSQHGGLMEYSVELVAPYPFWREAKQPYVEFTNAVGGFTFSTCFDEQNGKIFGQDGHVAFVNNQGDISSPVTIEIKNTAMTNPQIMLADGSYIGLTAEISANDTVTISTAYGSKQILVNGEYANALLTVGSQWIQLPVGVTQVSAFTGSGVPNIKLYYNNYYNSYTR